MEKETMIKNVRDMMRYADDKMKGIVKEDVEFEIEHSAYHYVKFAFYQTQGSCIEIGSHGKSYSRLFADMVTDYGGWCGGENVFTYDNAPSYAVRENAMRASMLSWGEIKKRIALAVEKENLIDNFVL